MRSIDVLAAREQLLPIWEANLPVRGGPDARLRWFYCDGPHGPGATLLLESASASGAAIGTAGVGARTLWYRGRKLRAALFADLAIEPQHRSVFPALSLVRAAKQHAQAGFDLGYGLPNAKATPVYRRAGYGELGVRSRYVRVLRSLPHIEKRIGNKLLARGAAAVIDRTVGFVTRARKIPLRGRVELRWLDRFDAHFDTLWDRARGLAPVLCERSSAFLTWRFRQQPGECYRIAGIFDVATGAMRAYAVVRDMGGTAEISDLFGADRADLAAMLTVLLHDLTRRGFGSVAFQLLAAQWVYELLALHGFVRRRDIRSVAIVIGDSMRGAYELSDPNAWYMTDLDEDA